MTEQIHRWMKHAPLLSLVLLCAAGASAQTENFTIAPDQSKVAFTVVDTLHTVHGTFHIQSGNVQFDLKGQQISGMIVVAAGSGDSGDPTRDRRMNENILQTSQFSIASFSPKQMRGTIAASGDSSIEVDGVFTLHGTPHDITVPMQIHIDGDHCTAKTHFLVPYVKWGMKDPSVFLIKVNKDVPIDLTLVGELSPAQPAH